MTEQELEYDVAMRRACVKHGQSPRTTKKSKKLPGFAGLDDVAVGEMIALAMGGRLFDHNQQTSIPRGLIATISTIVGDDVELVERQRDLDRAGRRDCPVIIYWPHDDRVAGPAYTYHLLRRDYGMRDAVLITSASAQDECEYLGSPDFVGRKGEAVYCSGPNAIALRNAIADFLG